MNDAYTESENQPNSNRGFRFLQTGLLVAGSALLGGLAVALWHRNSLAKLRQPASVSPTVHADAEEE
jgi:hypothetical protein